jgi:hypothetical protein
MNCLLEPARWVCLDASQSREKVQQDLREAIIGKLRALSPKP